MKRKTTILFLALILASALGIYLISMAESRASTELPAVKSDKFVVEREFSLEKRANGLYQDRYTYVSDILETVFDYNAVGVEWDGTIPEQSKFEIAVRSGEGDIWRDLDLERDTPDYLEAAEINSTELMFFSKPRKNLQYKLSLSTENPYQTPLIGKLEIHYFDSSHKSEAQAANILKALEASAEDFYIISRKEWGAKENLRLYNPDNPPPKILKSIDDETKAKYANELIIVSEIETNDNGEDLTWALQYPLKVDKFIIHHTATDYPTTLEESLAAVRDIYYWHTIVKGWGDIGYNYLIDPLGNVFEGRAGGDGVVAGHTAGHNVGSIGIAIMGRYSPCEDLYAEDSEEYLKCLAGDPDYPSNIVTPETEEALVNLIAYKAALFDINPLGESSWRGKIMANVLGHKDGAKTQCPGRRLYDKLPEIRQRAAQKYFEVLPNIGRLDLAKRFDYEIEKTPLYLAVPVGVPRELKVEAGTEIKVPLTFRNDGNMDWLKNSRLEVLHNYPDVEVTVEKRGLQRVVRSGELGVFEITINISSKARDSYTLAFYPVLNRRQKLEDARVNLTLQVNGNEQSSGGSENELLDTLSAVLTAKRDTELGENPSIRVLLSDFATDKAFISGSTDFWVYFGNDRRFKVPTGSKVKVRRQGAGLGVLYEEAEEETVKPVRLIGEGVLTVENMERRPVWNEELNDNTFRGILELRRNSENVMIINELPLEDYLKGVAEVPTGEPMEKMKTMAVIARGYAYQYLPANNRKFPGQPYDASDDPAVFQKYLGYNYELRTPDWLSAVTATEGKMLTYEDHVVKTPYFNQSDGRTRSAEEVWGWTDTPWLQSVKDPLCPAKELKGHGVGLSGCGAREAAKAGKSYEEILDYYYQDVSLDQIY